MSNKPAIASMSLGRAWVHSLPDKLKMAADHRFEGIEIFYEDLEYFSKSLVKSDELRPEDLIAGATEVRKLCAQNHLQVVGLQPFMHYEGLLSTSEHAAMIEKVKLWFQLAKILGTDVIQIPTQFRTEGVSGEMERIVADMREVADLGLQEEPVVKFAYENLCWGTFIDTWDGIWDVVEKVDRWNFGVCLDTFNIAGRVWGDPGSVDGKTKNADADLAASLEGMKKRIDVRKVWYVQVVGAEQLDQPLVPGHEFYAEDQPSRMSWSRNCRLFYGEEERGQYLPVREVAEVIFHDLKFEGWTSMELFSRTLADPKPEAPQEHAARGQKAWKQLVADLNL